VIWALENISTRRVAQIPRWNWYSGSREGGNSGGFNEAIREDRFSAAQKLENNKTTGGK
jgi:hypothetical protein